MYKLSKGSKYLCAFCFFYYLTWISGAPWHQFSFAYSDQICVWRDEMQRARRRTCALCLLLLFLSLFVVVGHGNTHIRSFQGCCICRLQWALPWKTIFKPGKSWFFCLSLFLPTHHISHVLCSLCPPNIVRKHFAFLFFLSLFNELLAQKLLHSFFLF